MSPLRSPVAGGPSHTGTQSVRGDAQRCGSTLATLRRRLCLLVCRGHTATERPARPIRSLGHRPATDPARAGLYRSPAATSEASAATSARCRADHLPRSRPHKPLPIPPQFEPCFSRDAWPHFHSRPFIKLYQRYVRAVQLLQRRDTIHSQPVTHWWRRSWEGAVAQPLAEPTVSPFPPFGIAEWLGFAPHPMPRPKPSEPYRSLGARFEQDLQDTWEAWRQLLADLDPSALRALHPRLVPPRACWLRQPTFEAGTPALGFV